MATAKKGGFKPYSDSEKAIIKDHIAREGVSKGVKSSAEKIGRTPGGITQLVYAKSNPLGLDRATIPATNGKATANGNGNGNGHTKANGNGKTNGQAKAEAPKRGPYKSKKAKEAAANSYVASKKENQNFVNEAALLLLSKVDVEKRKALLLALFSKEEKNDLIRILINEL